jgi:hypothetical protein
VLIMAKVRLFNRHTSPIDGVLPGTAGEFDDTPGIRRMYEAGLLSEGAPVAPIASGDLAALAKKLEAENAEIKAALDNAHASYEAQLTELRTALDAARAKPKKGGAPAPDAPPAEG